MFDEQEYLFDYISWLTQVNQTSTGEINLAKYKEVYMLGILSEVYELQAATPDNKLLEAGDVLAYGVLALVALGYSPEEIADVLCYRSMVIEPPLAAFTNDASKLYRGDEGNYEQRVEQHLFNFIFWAATVTGVTPYILSTYNREKLTKRLAANNGSFKGSGDNR